MRWLFQQPESHCIGTKLNTKALYSQNTKVPAEQARGEKHRLQGEIQATVFKNVLTRWHLSSGTDVGYPASDTVSTVA